MSNIRYINSLFDNYSTQTIQGLQIPKDQFIKILSRFSELIIEKTFDAEEVKLPIIGTLRIKKIKQKYTNGKMKLDFQATKKAGKKVYHLNEHRDGYFYKIMWKKNRIKNINYYSFIPERYHYRRPLAKLLKTDMTKDFFMS